MLVVDGQSLLPKRKGVNGKLIWKCSDHKDSKCIACCHTADGALAINIAVHDHVPNAIKIAARKTITDIKHQLLKFCDQMCHDLISMRPFARNLIDGYWIPIPPFITYISVVSESTDEFQTTLQVSLYIAQYLMTKIIAGANHRVRQYF